MKNNYEQRLEALCGIAQKPDKIYTVILRVQQSDLRKVRVSAPTAEDAVREAVLSFIEGLGLTGAHMYLDKRRARVKMGQIDVAYVFEGDFKDLAATMQPLTDLFDYI